MALGDAAEIGEGAGLWPGVVGRAWAENVLCWRTVRRGEGGARNLVLVLLTGVVVVLLATIVFWGRPWRFFEDTLVKLLIIPVYFRLE